MGKYSKITIGDLDSVLHFGKEQINHMVDVVKKYGLTEDGVCDYCDSNSIMYFTAEFVFQCLVHGLRVKDPIAGAMYPLIGEMAGMEVER